MKSTKNETLKVKDLKIHKYAHMNPMMDKHEFNSFVNDIATNGLKQPIDVCAEGNNYMVLEGRHRLEAHKILNIDEIKCIIHIGLTDKEKLDLVKSSENRRHQSPSQKAVTAWKYLNMQKELGNKMTQKEAADIVGADPRFISIINSIIKKYNRIDIIELIGNGEKINISDDDVSPFMTDSLRSIEKWLKKITSRMKLTENHLNEEIFKEEELTIEEELMAQEFINSAKKHMSLKLMKYVNKELFKEIKRIECE